MLVREQVALLLLQAGQIAEVHQVEDLQQLALVQGHQLEVTERQEIPQLKSRTDINNYKLVIVEK